MVRATDGPDRGDGQLPQLQPERVDRRHLAAGVQQPVRRGVGCARHQLGHEGQYPPGSTFKVTSTAAAVANGYPLDGLYDCPALLSIGGHNFVNDGNPSMAT